MEAAAATAALRLPRVGTELDASSTAPLSSASPPPGLSLPDRVARSFLLVAGAFLVFFVALAPRAGEVSPVTAPSSATASPLVGLCSGNSIVFPGASSWGTSAPLSSAAARPLRLDGGARFDGLLGLFFTAVFLARMALALGAGESLVTFAAFGLLGEVGSLCTAARLSGNRPLLALGLGAGEPAPSTDGLGSAFGAAARDFPRAFFVGKTFSEMSAPGLCARKLPPRCDAGLAGISLVLVLLVLRDVTLTSFLAGLLPLRAGVAGGVLCANEGWATPASFWSGGREPLSFLAEALASDPLALRLGEPWSMPPSFWLVEDEFLPF